MKKSTSVTVKLPKPRIRKTSDTLRSGKGYSAHKAFKF